MLSSQLTSINQIFTTTSPHVIYFSGGTASLLSEGHIKYICNHISCFSEIKTKAFEAHPDSLTLSKMNTLLQLGFNYFSLGIQTFDKTALQQINRTYVSPEHIAALIHQAHAHNAIVSVDLIAYLTEWNKNTIGITYKDLQILTSYVKPNCITVHMNYKKYRQTDEVNAVFHMIKHILSTSEYYTNMPEIYENNFDIRELSCHTHNIYHGDFDKICDAKDYNCSGPGGFPYDQNVFAIGGYGSRFPYSYIDQRQWYISGSHVYEVEYNTLHQASEF